MPLGNSNFPGALDVHANDASITPVEFGEQVRLLTLTLTANVNDSVTTFDTSSTAALPSKGIGVIGDETFTWSAKTANSLTVARGQFGSTASAHVIGDVIGIVPTAALINAHAKAITELEKKLGYKTGGANQVPAADTILGGDAAGQTSFRKVTAADLLEGTSTLKKIAEVVLAAPAVEIDFTSIPGTYRNLRLWYTLRGNDAGTNIGVNLRINNDSGANYDRQIIYAQATAVSALEGFGATEYAFGSMPGAGATANKAGSGLLFIPHYTNTSFHKMVHALQGKAKGITTGTVDIGTSMVVWRNTAAINRLTLISAASSFDTNSVVTLYGEPA